MEIKWRPLHNLHVLFIRKRKHKRCKLLFVSHMREKVFVQANDTVYCFFEWRWGSCLRGLGGGCAGYGVDAERRKGFEERGGKWARPHAASNPTILRLCTVWYNMSMFCLTIDILPWFCNLKYISSKWDQLKKANGFILYYVTYFLRVTSLHIMQSCYPERSVSSALLRFYFCFVFQSVQESRNVFLFLCLRQRHFIETF